MAGIDNLRTPTTEEAREIGRKGGIKSGEARKRRANLRALGLAMLEAQTLNEDQREMLREMGIDDSYGASLMMAMLKEAEGGSVEAAKFVRDTTGQAPKQVQQVITTEGMTSDDLRGMSDEELRSMLDQADEAEDEP